MKYFLRLLLIACLFSRLPAQINSNKCFPQNPPPAGSVYSNCEIQKPVKTQDKGYVFSFYPWAPNIHGAYPWDVYTIKTDSNFVPQWKKPYYAKAIPLATGGIILIYNTGINYFSGYGGMHIEKVTASGIQVWIKNYLYENINLADGVSYADKIRCVGEKVENGGFPNYTDTRQPYSIEIDTLGNFISQSLYNTPGGIYFSGIKRDAQGNFFVYSGDHTTSYLNNYVGDDEMLLVKFDPNFNVVWAKTGVPGTTNLLLRDLEILPGGGLFATGTTNLSSSSAQTTAVIVKFDAQGNLIQQNYFENRSNISGLCKKGNGNYIVSFHNGFYNSDSLFMFETDTSMNIQWHKYCTSGTGIGTSVIKNTGLYTPVFKGYNPFIVSYDLSGNDCASNSIAYTKLPSAIQLSNFTLFPAASTVALGTGTINVLLPQAGTDSCACPPVIQIQPFHTICTGNTATLSATGTGSICWYSSLSGNTLLSTGASITFSSGVATSSVFYVGDQLCFQRIPAMVNVISMSQLTVSPANPTVCMGSNVVFNALGASTYTWIGGQTGSTLTLSPTVNSTISVTGAGTICPVAPLTISITMVANPIVSASVSSNTICVGDSVTLSATGANYYYWNNAGAGQTHIVSPPVTTSYLVNGTSQYGCTDTASVVLYVVICTGLQTESSSERISLLPNPTSELITLNNLSLSKTTTLILTDATGRQIFSQQAVSEKMNLDLHDYAAGLYYVIIHNTSGQTTYKLIKE